MLQTFNQIVQNFLTANNLMQQNLPFLCFDLVENEVVAVVKISKRKHGIVQYIHNWIPLDQRNNEKHISKRLKTIAIVLESPHINEFACNRGDNKGDHPALGKTGTNLNKYLLDLINSFKPTKEINSKNVFDRKFALKRGKYRVVLVNLVKFQASLGEKTRLFRDKILSQMLANNNVFTANFKYEIKRFHPDVIINACTRQFKSKVWDLIDTINPPFRKTIFLESTHPSSWYSRFSYLLRKRIQ